MNHKRKVCVIGLGRISESHLIAIRKLKQLCALEAVVGSRKGIAREIARRFEAKKYYYKVEDALRDEKIEAVVICLPNDLHCKVAIEAAKAKKHILIEKPMANSSEEADLMIAEAEKNGVVLMVGQCRRFLRPQWNPNAELNKSGHYST